MKIDKEQVILKDNTVITLRSPHAGDTAQMIAFMRKTYGETSYLNRTAEEMEYFPKEREELYLNAVEESDNSFILCAFCGDEVVGNVGVSARGGVKLKHRADLGIAVLKAYWHKGIGTLLLERAITLAKKAGLEQLELEVVTTNTHALALYEREGFICTGTIPHAHKLYDGTFQDFYIMVKTL
jgi:ribosomal protein S18 acetylase RimI-like enzyme